MRNATAIVHTSPAAAPRSCNTPWNSSAEARSPAAAISGSCTSSTAGSGLARRRSNRGGYAYIPPGHATPVCTDAPARAVVIEKPYQPLHGVTTPALMSGRETDMIATHPRRRSMARGADLIPDDAAFDLRVNTMTFQPGAALPMVEIHVMEHGLLMLEGGGIYGSAALVSGRGRRFHLDGALLSAMVRRDRQAAGEIPDLQGLEPASWDRSRSAIRR